MMILALIDHKRFKPINQLYSSIGQVIVSKITAKLSKKS